MNDEETLTRIRKLAVPPAYENVWSYGLTTLRNRHVKLAGTSRISFDFRGKHVHSCFDWAHIGREKHAERSRQSAMLAALSCAAFGLVFRHAAT